MTRSRDKGAEPDVMPNVELIRMEVLAGQVAQVQIARNILTNVTGNLSTAPEARSAASPVMVHLDLFERALVDKLTHIKARVAGEFK